MAIKSFFFNSQDGDRTYNAADFAEFFKDYFTNGVFMQRSDALQVFANGEGVTVRTGRANINGYACSVTDAENIEIVSHATLTRIDAIALRLDLAGKKINIVKINGTAAESPAKPTPTRLGDIYELILAFVTIPPQATVIEQANIEDVRLDPQLCGIVTQAVASLDTSTFFNQLTSKMTMFYDEKSNEFNAWFSSISELLAGDVATNLTNTVVALEENQGLVYIATGSNDNIALRQLINTWLAAGNDGKQLNVKVRGDKFNCSAVIDFNGDNYSMQFGGMGTNRKVKIDFSEVGEIGGNHSFYADSTIEIYGLNYFAANGSALTSYGARIEKCILYGDTAGVSGSHVYAKDCKIKAICTKNGVDVYGVNVGGYLENCDISAENKGVAVAGAGRGAFGIYHNSLQFPLTVRGGSAIAHIPSSNTNGNEAIGFYVPANTPVAFSVNGCRFAQVARTNAKQTIAVKINYGYGNINGCSLYTAAAVYNAENVNSSGNLIANMATGLS